ncbi:replication initiation protein [Pseudoxanthomonas sp. LjRoot168]|uniref:replication initiation protein n=1 Tax=unclassified Pseudoxanthomonas TaxID=2645906 RepID=UPI003ECEE385
MTQQMRRGLAKLRDHDRYSRRQAVANDAQQGELLGFGGSELSPMSSRLPSVTLKKPGQGVSISNVLSAQQRKVWNVLLLNAYEELPDKDVKIHRMPLADLQLLIGFNSNNSKQLKDAIRALMMITLEWNIIEERGLEAWEATTALSSVQFRDGICFYEFSHLLRDRLYHPERFANLDLMEMRELSLTSAVALYENAARYRTLGATPWFSVETWRNLLGAHSPTYSDFRRFREKFIEPATAQLAELTSLNPKLEVRTQQRKTVAMRFLMDESATAGNSTEKADGQIGVEAGQGERQPADLSAVEQRMIDEMLLTPEQASACLAKHGFNHVEAVLDYVAKRFKAGQVDPNRVAGYFLKTVRTYTAPKTSTLVNQSAQPAGKAKADPDQVLADRIAAFSPVVRNISQRYFDALDADEQARVKAAFSEHLKRESNPMLRTWQVTPQHVACQALFRNFIVDFQLPVSRADLQDQYLMATVSDEQFIEAILAELQEAAAPAPTP